MSRLDEIRERLKWSSPKPWRVTRVENQRAAEVSGPGSDREVAGWPHSRVAIVGPVGYTHENAEFIANAPEDIAYLLAELEATEKRYQALVKAINDQPVCPICLSDDDRYDPRMASHFHTPSCPVAALEENPQT